jgi:hypothetical protein
MSGARRLRQSNNEVVGRGTGFGAGSACKFGHGSGQARPIDSAQLDGVAAADVQSLQAGIVDRDPGGYRWHGGWLPVGRGQQVARRMRGAAGASWPGTHDPARGRREGAPGHRPIVRCGELADRAVGGDQAVQRRAEHPQPLGRVRGRPPLPECSRRSGSHSKVPDPLAALVQRAKMIQDVADQILLTARADRQAQASDAAMTGDPVGSSGTVPGRGANRDGPPQPGWTGPPSWPSTTTAAERCLPWAGAI